MDFHSLLLLLFRFLNVINRALKPGIPLPLLDLTVDEKGVYVKPNKGNQSERFPAGPFNVDSISYGVQDLMYTRVFAMIVVGPAGTDPIATPTQPAQPKTPFTCYGFVCESRSEARQLTFSLSRTFQVSFKAILLSNLHTIKSRFNEWPPSAPFHSLNRDFTLNQDSLNRDFTVLISLP